VPIHVRWEDSASNSSFRFNAIVLMRSAAKGRHQDSFGYSRKSADHRLLRNRSIQ